MNRIYNSDTAHKQIAKLPSFLNTSVDSTLFKLLNIPSLEVERISKKMTDAHFNVIPTSHDTSLPAHLFTGETLVGGIEKRDLYDFTYGLPTSYAEDSSVSFVAITVQDIAYVAPMYYEDADGELTSAPEGYCVLSGESSWFSQKFYYYDTLFNLLGTMDLNTLNQDVNADTDEWITLDESNEYVLAKAYVDDSTVIVISPLEVNPSTGLVPLIVDEADYTYTAGTNTLEITDEDTQVKSLIVEYSYAPAAKLRAFTFLKDHHSILASDRNSYIPFALPALDDDEANVGDRNSPIYGFKFDLLNDAEDGLYPIAFEPTEVPNGSTVTGTLKVERVTQTKEFIGLFDDHNINLNGVAYYSRRVSFSASTSVECFDQDNTKLIEKHIDALDKYDTGIFFMHQGTSILFFSILQYGVSPLRFYITYQEDREIDEVVQETDVTYTFEEIEYTYTYLDSIYVLTSWRWNTDTSLWEANVVKIKQNNPPLSVSTTSTPLSIAWYPYKTYITEEDFGDFLLCITEVGLERYSLSGTLLDIITMANGFVPKVVRRYRDHIAVLATANDTDYSILFLPIASIKEVDLTVALTGLVEPTTFTFDRAGNIIVFDEDDDKMYTFIFERDYYTAIDDGLGNMTYWYTLTQAGTTRATIEHTLDQWGRVIGNDRWPSEELRNYLTRLSNVLQAKGSTSKQSALNGLSASFGLSTHVLADQSDLSTSYPFSIVEVEIVSRQVAGTEYFDLPTQLGSYSTDIIFLKDSAGDAVVGIDTLAHSAGIAPMKYSTISRTGALSGTYTIRYKPKLTVTSITAVTIEYDETDEGRALSTDVGRISFTNVGAALTTTVSYYTKVASDIIKSSGYRDFIYMYVEETIEIAPDTTTSSIIELVDIQKGSNYSTYSAIVDNLLLEDGLKFKWGEFTWDAYRWKDGENIKTGVTTLFDEDLTAGAIFATGTVGRSLEILEQEPTLKLRTGSFVTSENMELYLFPKEPIVDLISAGQTALTSVPSPLHAITLQGDVEAFILVAEEADGYNDFFDSVNPLDDRVYSDFFDGKEAKELHSYAGSSSALRPITDASNFNSGASFYPVVSNYIDSYAFEDNSMDSFLVDDDLEVTFTNAITEANAFYSLSEEIEYDTKLTPTEDLLLDDKLYAIVNTEVADIDDITIDTTFSPSILQADFDELWIHVTVYDIDYKYIPNALISSITLDAVEQLDNGKTYLTNFAGEAVIPIDISNVSDDADIIVTVTLNAEDSTSSTTILYIGI